MLIKRSFLDLKRIEVSFSFDGGKKLIWTVMLRLTLTSAYIFLMPLH